MKVLYKEIQARRAARSFLEKKSSPDGKRIKQLSAEIFELQRAILTKSGVVAPLPA